jgi:hypothetical protein
MNLIINKLENTALDLFVDFSVQIESDRRYFFDYDFKEIMPFASEHYAKFLRTGETLYRSRIGADLSDSTKINQPFGIHEMLTPSSSITPNGRANPSGIPYLYTSFEKFTCVCESRPWKKARISLLTLILSKDLFILDLTNSEIIPSDLFFPQNLHKVIPNRLFISI